MKRVVYGPPTLAQELSRILRLYPHPLTLRAIAPRCVGCGRTPAVRCCPFGADRA